MSWAVIVPSNRAVQLRRFVMAWTPLFIEHDIEAHYVWDGTLPEDHDEGGFLGDYTWEGIPDFIPRKTDQIRSWGIYNAHRNSIRGKMPDYCLSLDDDVLPIEGVDIFAEYERVFEAGAPCSDYLDVGALTSFDGQMRGFPFGHREKAEVAIQYGGWHGVLDYDAPTQLAGVNAEETFAPVVLPVPRGVAVTGCAMNMAWRTEYAPIMWQLPLYAEHTWSSKGIAPDKDSRKCETCGREASNAQIAMRQYPGCTNGRYNRFGDIWSCLFQKRVLDALGKVMVINGKASVRHERASDPIANLERETPGIRLNEEMWGDTGALPQDSSDMIRTYRDVTNMAIHRAMSRASGEYATHFYVARDKWLDLFA